jgi:MipA family protein
LTLANRAAALLALLCIAAPAAAEQKPLWEAGVGLSALTLPHYRGSDQNQSWLLPLPYFVYRGDIFRADRDGARAVFVDSQRFDVDVSVSATAPTRGDDNIARRGMPELAGTLQVGPNVNIRLANGPGWKAELRLPAHAVLTLQRSPKAIGWTAQPNINVDWRVGEWNIGAQAGLLAGTRRYHDYLYGVDSPYATPDRPAYQAPGGGAGWRLTSGVSRRSGNWWFGAFVRADSVAGASFHDSPLVKRDNNLSAGVALSWVFAQSDRRVDAND